MKGGPLKGIRLSLHRLLPVEGDNSFRKDVSPSHTLSLCVLRKQLSTDLDFLCVCMMFRRSVNAKSGPYLSITDHILFSRTGAKEVEDTYCAMSCGNIPEFICNTSATIRSL